MPLRMRPRIETLPVKGHFLSMYVPYNERSVESGGGTGVSGPVHGRDPNAADPTQHDARDSP
jgi:hypothetical protein